MRLWGLRILQIPGRRPRRTTTRLGKWLFDKLDGVLARQETNRDSAKDASSEKPPKARRSRPGLFRWVARSLVDLLGRLTRRLRVRCGGVDPALLGALSGVVAILRGALGTRRLEWIPDFAPTALRVEIRWDLSLSVWKLFRWGGESFLDRNRRSGSRRDL